MIMIITSDLSAKLADTGDVPNPVQTFRLSHSPKLFLCFAFSWFVSEICL